MILVDLNQVMISNLMVTVNSRHFKGTLDEDLIRHQVLNTIRFYRTKFHENYGELIICCDDRHYWRKDVFPYYKASRKKDRDKSDLDWHMIFNVLKTIKDEIREVFPYKVIQIDGAEADDIIGTLCHEYGHLGINGNDPEPILILSSDKDFMQLQKYANVEQYSTIQKKFLRCSNPARYIAEHIMRGDRGDGVPNFLSDDDTFVNGKRQKPISAKKIDLWQAKQPEDFCDERMLRGFRRNQQLVDLDYIPKDIQENILEEYNKYECNSRSLLLNYFVKNKLKNLMENIQEF
tara:strand:- start:2766 stop:3638 length:873 start_codon:yes stop_codon:yes gene_type:complete